MNKQIFDTLLEPVFIINSELQIVYCNEAASLLTELNPRKIIRAKMSLLSLFKFSDSITYLENITSVKEATPYKELSFSTQKIDDGKMQMTMQLFAENEWLIFFRDVTLEERLQRKYKAELNQKETVIEDLKIARAQLEKYSKELESIVDERTKELKSLNSTMKALLDSLNQAFFVFNKDGDCLPIFSKSCLELLELNPADRKVWDVLGLSNEKIPGFKDWMLTIFNEMLPFEDLAVLGPIERKHSLGKNISLEYFPIRNTENSIEHIVCMATNITDLVEAKKNFEYEKNKVQAILKMVANRDQIKMFFNESNKNLKKLSELLSDNLNPEKLEEIYRIIHTLKGGAATFSYSDLKNQSHQFESLLNLIATESMNDLSWQKEGSNSNEIPKLEKDKSLLQDLVLQIEKSLAREILNYETMFRVKFDSQNKNLEISKNDFMSMLNSLKTENLKKILIDKYLFQSLESYTNQIDSLVINTCTFLKKPIPNLNIKGASLRIPINKFSGLLQQLNHIIRNSLDHGIESSQDRRLLRKSEKGNLSIFFSIEEKPNNSGFKNEFKIEIFDDGSGINTNKLKEKLLLQNYDVSNLTDEMINQKIFDPKISTKDNITEVSGQGVGLNAVLNEVKKLSGEITVYSEKNNFTKFVITVPYNETEVFELYKAS